MHTTFIDRLKQNWWSDRHGYHSESCSC